MSQARELREMVDAIAEPLLPASVKRIALIDVPNHQNVGDQAILLGEYAFLKRCAPQARIDFYDVVTYTGKSRGQIEAADVLLLHGGGNFGDLWPRHQALRKSVLKSFAHKPIIQMPQSIYFSREAELSETAALIEGCQSFVLLVRDSVSLSKAERFACKTLLCPDMAFAMSDLKRSAPVVDCFALLRTDKEAIADHAATMSAVEEAGLSILVDDWMTEPRLIVSGAAAAFSRVARRFPHFHRVAGGLIVRLRLAYARDRLRAGLAMLSQGKMVVTDRLHAHILSCLSGIPNVALDTLDGKVAALFKTWTHKFPGTALSTTSDVGADLRGLAR